jgi:tryptophan synthase
MEAINAVFAACKKESRAALVTYVTAGYPTASSTPEIMLSMQAGGAGTCLLTNFIPLNQPQYPILMLLFQI